MNSRWEASASSCRAGDVSVGFGSEAGMPPGSSETIAGRIDGLQGIQS